MKKFWLPTGFDWQQAEIANLFGLLAAARGVRPIETTFGHDGTEDAPDYLIFEVETRPYGVIFFKEDRVVACFTDETGFKKPPT